MIYRTCKYPNCGELLKPGETYCSKHANRKRYCKHPGCFEIITEGVYCDRHNPAKQYDRMRHDRDGVIYGHRWTELATAFKKKHAICMLCEIGLNKQKRKEVTPAEIVHHMHPVRDGGKIYDSNNLISVCASCHKYLHQLINNNPQLYNELISKLLNKEFKHERNRS